MTAVPATRRRGDALREAVFSATLVEIEEHGVRGASMDRIARRAGTGKASLYRRWPNVRALTLDVFLDTLAECAPEGHPDTGSLREDLVTALRDFTRALDGPLAVVLRQIISEAAHDPSLVDAFQERFGIPMQAEVVVVIQRAMARGEIPVAPVDPLALEMPAALVLHRLLIAGTLPSDEEIAHLFDSVVLPLLGGATPPR